LEQEAKHDKTILSISKKCVGVISKANVYDAKPALLIFVCLIVDYLKVPSQL